MPRIIGRVNVEELTGFWQKDELSLGAHVVVADEDEDVEVVPRAIIAVGPETSPILYSGRMCQLRNICSRVLQCSRK